MKIGLNLQEAITSDYSNNVEKVIPESVNKNEGIRLDLNKDSFSDTVYKEKKKSINDIMQEAETIDVQAARNYMAVLSNTMSEDDYKKAMEDGFDPAKMDPKDSVTILDHIKAVMAESGQIIQGYNDDLDNNTISEVTGMNINLDSLQKMMEDYNLPATNDSLHNIEEAVSLVSDIDTFSENNIRYMVENNLEPTIENVYMARYSSANDTMVSKGYFSEDANGYYAKKADYLNWDILLPQVENSLEKMEISDIPKDHQIDDAKWLLEQGIPVTKENITDYENIKSIEFPIPIPKIVRASIRAIAMGLSAKKGNLAEEKDIYTKAFEQKTTILNAQIDREQARLDMSIDANIRLLKKGISLDTSSIEEVLEKLMDEEQKLKEQFLGKGTVEELNAKTDIFVNTRNILEELPSLPVSMVNWISDKENKVNLEEIHDKGVDLKKEYEAASKLYEEIGTEVRKDLGDSINKAFRNVDDILTDLGLDISADNRRAVRILGYNSLQISVESIDKILDSDLKLQKIINNLTPAKTLQLIRDGVNPLKINLDEIVNKLDEMENDSLNDLEKYSKFLYKIDKSGEITEQEKESYIGIYRLINRLEKTDHAAIGKVLNSGIDITFGNLLSAMRSELKNINVSIDDNFGLLEETIEKGTSISDQIMSAFENQTSNEENEASEESYTNERMEYIRETAKAENEVYESLINNSVKITPDNLEAETAFLSNQNSLFRKLLGFNEKTDKKNGVESARKHIIEESINDFDSNIDNEDTIKEEYNSMLKTFADSLVEYTDTEENNLLDIRGIMTMHKQLSLAADYAKEENYHIPVMVDDSVVDINLKLVHGNEKGTVVATFDADEFGKFSSRFDVSGDSVNSLLLVTKKDSMNILEGIKDDMDEFFKNEGFKDIRINGSIGNPERISKLSSENVDNNNESVDTAVLYKIAKKYIYTIKEKIK